MLDRFEHVAAVIGFDHNRRAPAQSFRNQRCYVTKIEQGRDLLELPAPGPGAVYADEDGRPGRGRGFRGTQQA